VSAALGKSFVRIPERNEDGASGVFYLILIDAAAKFNFTFSLHQSNHGGASGFKKNGRWHGAVLEWIGMGELEWA